MGLFNSVKTFSGGVHVRDYKGYVSTKKIIESSPPQEVVIPLQQHIGAPCAPLVEKGQKVKMGQKIGDTDNFVSAPVHSSISGEVTAVERRKSPLGKMVQSVVIKSDSRMETYSEKKDLPGELPAADELRQKIREAGIVGLGGAAFPTHVKLSPPSGKEIDCFIVNGCECEPYLSGDHRLMLEYSRDVILGLRIIEKILGVKKTCIAIEDNKPGAISAMQKAAAGKENLEVVTLKTRYPQGAEKILIKAVLDREVPAGGLPLDAGVVVNNVGTVKAVSDAVIKGLPLVERVVTVTGSNLKTPGNIRARIGTSFEHLIKECGGLLEDKGKIIMGGPMMGKTQHSLNFPVVKGTSGIVVLKESDAELQESGPCIRCARCVDACPMGLLPVILAELSEHKQVSELEDHYVLDCIECGCCSYICPAKMYLLHWIRLGKAEVAAKRAGS